MYNTIHSTTNKQSENLAWRVLWHAFQHSRIVNLVAVDLIVASHFWQIGPLLTTWFGLTAMFGPLFLVKRQCVIAPACITGSETQTKHRKISKTQILQWFLTETKNILNRDHVRVWARPMRRPNLKSGRFNGSRGTSMHRGKRDMPCGSCQVI